MGVLRLSWLWLSLSLLNDVSFEVKALDILLGSTQHSVIKQIIKNFFHYFKNNKINIPYFGG